MFDDTEAFFIDVEGIIRRVSNSYIATVIGCRRRFFHEIKKENRITSDHYRTKLSCHEHGRRVIRPDYGCSPSRENTS